MVLDQIRRYQAATRTYLEAQPSWGQDAPLVARLDALDVGALSSAIADALVPSTWLDESGARAVAAVMFEWSYRDYSAGSSSFARCTQTTTTKLWGFTLDDFELADAIAYDGVGCNVEPIMDIGKADRSTACLDLHILKVAEVMHYALARHANAITAGARCFVNQHDRFPFLAYYRQV
jgi:hypothetical protein